MSHATAQVWIRTAIDGHDVREDALRELGEAVARGSGLVLWISPQLMTKDQGCLARWDGHHLTAVPLGREELQAYRVPRSHMLCQPFALLDEPEPDIQFTLSDLVLESAARWTAGQPVCGRVHVKVRVWTRQQAWDAAGEGLLRSPPPVIQPASSLTPMPWDPGPAAPWRQVQVPGPPFSSTLTPPPAPPAIPSRRSACGS